MECRLGKDTPVQQKPEPMHLTKRPSSGDRELQITHEEPEDEADPTAGINLTKTELPDNTSKSNSSSTLAVPPRTVTSQLSDIVDMCEGMEEEEIQTETEMVLERILRAQYQLEQCGDTATPETASLVERIDARFQEFLKKYVGEQNDASLSSARAVLDSINTDLDTANSQFNRT
ncbi:hypothetical protein V7S43_007205 [Phytophthora oleae]|uniref:Uncharacterized protein n=1 Tax=Phytophthora oleae TaxID=2107226 RepID=A0ABD3FMU6_9STRA